MKKIKQISQLALFVLELLISSCSSDSEGCSISDATDGTITAKVNGKTVTNIASTTLAVIFNTDNYIFQLSGSALTCVGFFFSVSGYHRVGVYPVSLTADFAVTCNYVDFNFNTTQEEQIWTSPADTQTTGTFEVTEVTATRMKGKFQFNAKNMDDNSYKTTSSGSFNVKLTQF